MNSKYPPLRRGHIREEEDISGNLSGYAFGRADTHRRRLFQAKFEKDEWVCTGRTCQAIRKEQISLYSVRVCVCVWPNGHLSFRMRWIPNWGDRTRDARDSQGNGFRVSAVVRIFAIIGNAVYGYAQRRSENVKAFDQIRWISGLWTCISHEWVENSSVRATRNQLRKKRPQKWGKTNETCCRRRFLKFKYCIFWISNTATLFSIKSNWYSNSKNNNNTFGLCFMPKSSSPGVLSVDFLCNDTGPSSFFHWPNF